MSEAVSLPDFNSSIADHARKDFPLLDAGMSVADALDRIRREGVGERVIYFLPPMPINAWSECCRLDDYSPRPSRRGSRR
ncbi:MAG: hypothetical protein QOH88_871 [Verrucomicrobiota bacterium]|jgi:hypothetical protein